MAISVLDRAVRCQEPTDLIDATSFLPPLPALRWRVPLPEQGRPYHRRNPHPRYRSSRCRGSTMTKTPRRRSWGVLGQPFLQSVFAVVLAASGTSHAYTPEQQACQPDALRLCGEFVLNGIDAITACMIQKKSQLSPQCRAFFRSGRGSREAAASPPSC